MRAGDSREGRLLFGGLRARSQEENEEEEEEIDGGKDPVETGNQEEKEDVVLLDPLLDPYPRYEDTRKDDDRGEEDHGYAYTVHTYMVGDAE